MNIFSTKEKGIGEKNGGKGLSANLDRMEIIHNFREGVQGISSSVQQFEKTMDSLTQLYQTMESMGAFKGFPLFTPVSGSTRLTPSVPEMSNIFEHVKTFVRMLEKVDFNQINQFLNSAIVKEAFYEEPTNKK